MGKKKRELVGSTDAPKEAPKAPTKAKRGSTKSKVKSALFYASADKFKRATALAKSNRSSVKAEYEKLGGAFLEGRGHAPVK